MIKKLLIVLMSITFFNCSAGLAAVNAVENLEKVEQKKPCKEGDQVLYSFFTVGDLALGTLVASNQEHTYESKFFSTTLIVSSVIGAVMSVVCEE
jgi:hypothetical protein